MTIGPERTWWRDRVSLTAIDRVSRGVDPNSPDHVERCIRRPVIDECEIRMR